MLHRLLRGTAFTGTAAKINTAKNNTLQQTQKPAAAGSCAYISAKLTFSSLCAGCRTIIVGVCYSFPALIEAATFSALVGGILLLPSHRTQTDRFHNTKGLFRHWPTTAIQCPNSEQPEQRNRTAYTAHKKRPENAPRGRKLNDAKAKTPTRTTTRTRRWQWLKRHLGGSSPY